MKAINFKRLANISPGELSRFLPELVSTFIEETGIERGDDICIALITAPDSEALTRIDWSALSSALFERAKLPGDKIDTFLQHAHILIDRVILYGRIRRAISGSELVRQGKYPLPHRYPEELQPTIAEFHQLKYRMDDELHCARVETNQFQHLLVQGAAIPTLRRHLHQASDAYAAYQQTSERLGELHWMIYWYLSQVRASTHKSTSAA
jgi:hypothetical protein